MTGAKSVHGRHVVRLSGVVVFAVLVVGFWRGSVETQSRPTLVTEEAFLQSMQELSNQGRWGADETGAANLITAAKGKRAAALVSEGISVFLAHDVIQEDAIDAFVQA